mmetsp:Transcript_6945/g.8754  ORF Transcript_6945/g.8754 Transcript_6945/m.8754 type:complete len:83 (-) Transcript_6945:821-1069(-)
MACKFFIRLLSVWTTIHSHAVNLFSLPQEFSDGVVVYSSVIPKNRVLMDVFRADFISIKRQALSEYGDSFVVGVSLQIRAYC